MKKNYKILNNINFPSDLRKIPEQDLQKVSDEVRREMINAVSETGGHLGAGLGVVELTVALHYVFNTPNDKLIWDVGHQTYPHKILTGRKSTIRSLRQGKGLSGFTNTTCPGARGLHSLSPGFAGRIPPEAALAADKTTVVPQGSR